MAPHGIENATFEPAAENANTAVDELIYDVGMARGEDAAFYLALGYRVVGFEADAANVEHLHERFSAEIAQGRLTVAADTDPTESLRHAVAASGIPHFMKINTSRHDREILAALGELSRPPRFISVEAAGHAWTALLAQFDLLTQLGYHRFSVVARAKVPGSILRTSDRTGKPIEYRFPRDASGAFGGDLAPWVRRDVALDRYGKVLRDQRRFGENANPRTSGATRAARLRLAKFAGRSFPGPFDTHAMHSG